MIIHNQGTTINQNNTAIYRKGLNEKSDIVNIPISVIDNGGKNSYNYTISKNKNELFGNSLRNSNKVTEVTVNGATIPLSQLENTPVSIIKSIQVVMNNGAEINGYYKINGNTFKLPSNSLNEITNNSAKIYVPNYILLNQDKCSVNINGKDYTGVQNGDYVQVNGPISINSNGENTVTVNVNTNKSVTTPQNESTQIIVLNQNGMQLYTKTLNKPTGLQLALAVANLKGNITSMTYNGDYLDLTQLMEENYQQNSQNLLVITEYSEPTINANMTFDTYWNGQTYNHVIYVPNLNDQINTENAYTSTGAIINLPPVLVRKFDINYITINNQRYKGYLNGDKYYIDQYIPNAPCYSVMVNTTRKEM